LNVKSEIDNRETVSSNMIKAALGMWRLVVARDPLTLPVLILLTWKGCCCRFRIAICPNLLGHFPE
jgi:hypothetical protein